MMVEKWNLIKVNSREKEKCFIVSHRREGSVQSLKELEEEKRTHCEKDESKVRAKERFTVMLLNYQKDERHDQKCKCKVRGT